MLLHFFFAIIILALNCVLLQFYIAFPSRLLTCFASWMECSIFFHTAVDSFQVFSNCCWKVLYRPENGQSLNNSNRNIILDFITRCDLNRIYIPNFMRFRALSIVSDLSLIMRFKWENQWNNVECSISRSFLHKVWKLMVTRVGVQNTNERSHKTIYTFIGQSELRSSTKETPINKMHFIKCLLFEFKINILFEAKTVCVNFFHDSPLLITDWLLMIIATKTFFQHRNANGIIKKTHF